MWDILEDAFTPNNIAQSKLPDTNTKTDYSFLVTAVVVVVALVTLFYFITKSTK